MVVATQRVVEYIPVSQLVVYGLILFLGIGQPTANLRLPLLVYLRWIKVPSILIIQVSLYLIINYWYIYFIIFDWFINRSQTWPRVWKGIGHHYLAQAVLVVVAVRNYGCSNGRNMGLVQNHSLEANISTFMQLSISGRK